MPTDTRYDVGSPAPSATSVRHGRAPRHRLSFIGVLGELLIFAGALLALFVVWQLFYTDVQGERAQREQVEQADWLDRDVVDGVTAGDDGVQTIPDELKMRGIDPPAMDYPEFTEAFAAMMVPR